METSHSGAGCAPKREDQFLNTSRKCLSLDHCKEINQKSRYVNFSAAVLNFLRKDLTRSEKDLWEFLSAEVVFSADWSIIITNESIAEKIQRHVRTVSRLLTALVIKGYLERERHAGQASLIRVRLPESITAEFKGVRTRRQKTPDKNVRGQTACTYYLYNINHNNRDSSKSEKIVPKPSEIVVDHSAEIEKIEAELAELNPHITEKCKELVKIPIGPEKTKKYAELEQLQKKNYALQWRLERIKPRITRIPKSLTSARQRIPLAGARIISEFDRARLAAALADKPNSERLTEEAIFSLCHPRGSLRRSKWGGEMSISNGISIFQKLVKAQRWETPAGMCQ